MPFNPAHWPFFYGWTILGFGTLGIVMSVPGQTVGVSVFTNHLIHALSISRNLLSLAYMAGTVSSALILSFAGRLYDRFGGRIVATAAATGLGGILLVLSESPRIVSGLEGLLPFLGPAVGAFVVMAPSFFLLRFFGQGVLTLSSRNMVMEWFEQRRGFVNAIMGVSVSFGFSYAPRVFQALIDHGDWERAWRVMALVLFAFAVVAAAMFRDKPEAHGLLPDGGEVRRRRSTHPETHAGYEFTVHEARHTYTFWIFALTLLLSALLMTAFTFNVVSIFAEAGMGSQTAIRIFFPASVVAVAFEFLGSYLSDFIRLKFLLMVQLTGMILVSVALMLLRAGFPVVLLVAGQGLIQGMFGIISNITWPRFFGRAHLGAVSGFVTALGVAGSAVGPYLFSLANSLTGSYRPAELLCLVVAVVLLAGSTRADRPRPPAGAQEKP